MTFGKDLLNAQVFAFNAVLIKDAVSGHVSAMSACKVKVTQVLDCSISQSYCSKHKIAIYSH